MAFHSAPVSAEKPLQRSASPPSKVELYVFPYARNSRVSGACRLFAKCAATRVLRGASRAASVCCHGCAACERAERPRIPPLLPRVFRFAPKNGKPRTEIPESRVIDALSKAVNHFTAPFGGAIVA